ncbi:hypothetical protein BGX26_005841, partial [Mortierella sp. AD094]
VPRCQCHFGHWSCLHSCLSLQTVKIPRSILLPIQLYVSPLISNLWGPRPHLSFPSFQAVSQ